MAPPGLPREEFARRMAAAERHRQTGRDWINRAADELGIHRVTYRRWLNEHGILADRYRLENQPPTHTPSPHYPPLPKEPEEPLAVRQERRLKDEISRLRSDLNKANRDLNAAEDLREAVFGLGKPLESVTYHPRVAAEREGHGIEIPILMTSDFQWGEVINLDEMDGLNSYNKDIAAERYRRLIESAIACCLRDNMGAPPPAFYYLRGGDAISGSIHEELAETNDLSSIPAVRDLAGHERWGIKTIADELNCPVHVISVPGNHDRTTKKPRSKSYVDTSFDSLISWHLEMCFEGDDRVTFSAPASGDAYFTVHKTNFALTHGDNMGTGGGTGYIGAVAAITKGHRKIVESALHAGRRVDYVFSGHFHTAVETEYGFGNGCLPGLSEYAQKKIRPKPSPPTQWLVSVHPERGVTTRRKLMVGAPGEGSLCEPKGDTKP
jgi:hypothetical protein